MGFVKERLSIEHLAKLAFVSKSNFFKLFKYELGTSPNEYILQQRIKRAKELLKENQSIKEVAFATGFSDTNHLIKTFKRRYYSEKLSTKFIFRI